MGGAIGGRLTTIGFVLMMTGCWALALQHDGAHCGAQEGEHPGKFPQTDCWIGMDWGAEIVIGRDIGNWGWGKDAAQQLGLHDGAHVEEQGAAQVDIGGGRGMGGGGGGGGKQHCGVHIGAHCDEHPMGQEFGIIGGRGGSCGKQHWGLHWGAHWDGHPMGHVLGIIPGGRTACAIVWASIWADWAAEQHTGLQEGAQLDGQPFPHVGGGWGIGGPDILGLHISGLPMQEGDAWIGCGLTAGVCAGGGFPYTTKIKNCSEFKSKKNEF